MDDTDSEPQPRQPQALSEASEAADSSATEDGWTTVKSKRRR